MTGSTTRGGPGCASSASQTASTMAAVASMPVLTAAISKSSNTAQIWAATIRGETGSTAVTDRVFWAVTAVTAVAPWTPWAASVLMSACRPAPAPESLPAMVRTAGTTS